MIFVFVSGLIFGQDSPQNLGETFFILFKSNNIKPLDTLTSSCNDVKKIYLEIDSTLSILQADNFCEKFDYRNKKFKKKCEKLRMDTTLFNINWNTASLQNIDYYKKEMNNEKGSNSNTKTLTSHHLIIIFNTNNRKYSIEFKGINKLGNKWKLGQQIRMKEIKNE